MSDIGIDLFPKKLDLVVYLLQNVKYFIDISEGGGLLERHSPEM